MKSLRIKLAVFLISITGLSSCYTSRLQVGDGPQEGVVYKAKNQHFLFGTVPGKQVSVQRYTQEVQDYQVTIDHTLSDVVLGIITLGIYTPNTVYIEK